MTFINCTLIVQAINFFIAFFLIKYFFFKPVLAQIHAEDAFQESLIATVQTNRAIVTQKEQELVAQWHTTQNYFEKHSPSTRHEPFFSTKPTVIKPEFESHTINDSAKRAAADLIRKVDHVR